jgi:hypothetical protein
MDAVEKGLLNLTHWIWAKRNGSTEIERIPNPAVEAEPAVKNIPVKNIAVKKTAVKKPAVKRTPRATKGNEWSVK